MHQRQRDAKNSTATSLLAELLGKLLVRCAICEGDQALVGSHRDADRLLTAHLVDCPGPIGSAERRGLPPWSTD